MKFLPLRIYVWVNFRNFVNYAKSLVENEKRIIKLSKAFKLQLS